MALAFRAVGTSAVATTNVSSVAPGIPTGVQIGDMLVAVVIETGTPATVYSMPAGWTSRAEAATAGGGRYAVFTRVADGTEGATVTISRSSGKWVAKVAAYSGLPTYDKASTKVNANGTTHPATALTTAEANEMLVFCIMGEGFADPVSGVTPPATYNERAEVPNSTSWTWVYIADVVQPGQGTTGAPQATSVFSSSSDVALVALGGDPLTFTPKTIVY